jgi:hypothetical protein
MDDDPVSRAKNKIIDEIIWITDGIKEDLPEILKEIYYK